MRIVPTFTRCLCCLILVVMTACQQTPASAPESDLAAVTPRETALFQEPTLTQKAAPIQTPEMSTEIQPDILDIPYTEDNPLTDADEILKILDMLVQKHIAWLSRPGWYLYWEHIQGESIAEQYAESIDEQYVQGVHFINEFGECDEQFFFIIREGQILPRQIQLKDGTMAKLYDQREPSSRHLKRVVHVKWETQVMYTNSFTKEKSSRAFWKKPKIVVSKLMNCSCGKRS